MKKIILPIICSVLALSFTGCDMNSESQTLQKLDSQLETTYSVVYDTNANPNLLNSSVFKGLNEENPSNYYKARTYKNEERENDVKQEVLGLASLIKSNHNHICKLGKNKTNAIKELTSSLSRYTRRLEKTKVPTSQKYQNIKKYTSLQNVNGELAKSNLIELNNLMEERATYLYNLRDTLEGINNILDESCYQNQDNQEQSESETINNQTSNTSNQDKNSKSILRKNIDTYNSSRNVMPSQNINNQYSYNNPSYTFNNNQVNNPNYYYRDYRFNPNRNTDTFYPRVKNIDTYRYNPYYNGNLPYGAQPYTNQPYTNQNNYLNQNLTPVTNEEKTQNNDCQNQDNCNVESKENISNSYIKPVESEEENTTL